MKRKYRNPDLGDSSGMMSFHGLLLVWLIFIICAPVPCFADESQVEKAVIIKEAKSYFEAEMSGDPKAVWEALAPSSAFKRQHSFEDYLEIQSRSELSVAQYEVMEVLEIMENNDRIALPDVEKLAAVKVHVKIRPKKGKESEHDNIFIFLKEKGKWFKG